MGSPDQLVFFSYSLFHMSVSSIRSTNIPPSHSAPLPAFEEDRFAVSMRSSWTSRKNPGGGAQVQGLRALVLQRERVLWARLQPLQSSWRLPQSCLPLDPTIKVLGCLITASMQGYQSRCAICFSFPSMTIVKEQSRLSHRTHPWCPDFHKCPASLWVGTESGTVGAGMSWPKRRCWTGWNQMATGSMF